jgi:WD40 repeat protein
MRLLQGHRPAVCCLAFTPDGRLLAGTRDGTLTVWDPASGEERLSLALGARHPYPFLMALAPDGQTVAVGGQYLTLSFWDTTTGQLLPLLPRELPAVFGLAFAPDGRTFTAVPTRGADRQHFLRRWDLSTRQELLPPLYQSGCTIAAPAFSPDGKTLAVTVYERGRPVLLFDLETGTEKVRWAPPSEVTALTWLSDGRTLAVRLSRSAVLFDAVGGKVRGRLKGHTRQVNGLAVSPDGRLLATASDDGMVRLWDAGSGKCRAVRDWGIGEVREVAFAPDGMTAAAGGASGLIAFWDVDEGGA